jgi:hypothetical protein
MTQNLTNFKKKLDLEKRQKNIGEGNNDLYALKIKIKLK